jgi:hypothetical protein
LQELAAGRLDAASAEIEKEPGEWYQLEGRAILAFAGKRLPESNAALARLIDCCHAAAALQIAQAYAYRGERDKAFEWLDRSYQQKDQGLVNIKTDAFFAGLRNDPRFSDLLRRMKLPEN